MIKNLGNNLSGIEWQCSHCGALNKVSAAKFCGKCGSAREKTIVQPVLKAENNSNSQGLKVSARTKVRILKFLKRFFYPTKKKMYKTINKMAERTYACLPAQSCLFTTLWTAAH